MRRLIIIAATAAATAIPAVIGLTGNPALSHRVPVQAPSQTIAVQQATEHPGPSTSRSSSTHSEPGDDRGRNHSEPGDDRGRSSTHSEPGDDKGGSSTHSEPGDDKGGSSTHSEPGDDKGGSSTHSEPGDDRGGSTTHSGGHGGHGGDDGPGQH